MQSVWDQLEDWIVCVEHSEWVEHVLRYGIAPDDTKGGQGDRLSPREAVLAVMNAVVQHHKHSVYVVQKTPVWIQLVLQRKEDKRGLSRDMAKELEQVMVDVLVHMNFGEEESDWGWDEDQDQEYESIKDVPSDLDLCEFMDKMNLALECFDELEDNCLLTALGVVLLSEKISSFPSELKRRVLKSLHDMISVYSKRGAAKFLNVQVLWTNLKSNVVMSNLVKGGYAHLISMKCLDKDNDDLFYNEDNSSKQDHFFASLAVFECLFSSKISANHEKALKLCDIFSSHLTKGCLSNSEIQGFDQLGKLFIALSSYGSLNIAFRPLLVDIFKRVFNALNAEDQISLLRLIIIEFRDSNLASMLLNFMKHTMTLNHCKLLLDTCIPLSDTSDHEIIRILPLSVAFLSILKNSISSEEKQDGITIMHFQAKIMQYSTRIESLSNELQSDLNLNTADPSELNNMHLLAMHLQSASKILQSVKFIFSN
jgi:hypothetical protein